MSRPAQLHLALHDVVVRCMIPAVHDPVPSQVLRLPMSFFDSQPAGRLLNRFSQDTESTDVVVRETIAWCLTCVGATHPFASHVLGRISGSGLLELESQLAYIP